MPRYNIEYRGKWAHYSGIADGFLTEFMDLKEYEKWRTLEYGHKKVPLGMANKKSLNDCINDMVEVHGRRITIRHLMDVLMMDRNKVKNLVKRSRKKIRGGINGCIKFYI